MMDLRAWLQNLDLERYEVAFRENAIGADVLRDLTDQDLEKIGVLLGDRRRLLRAIVELDRAPPSTILAPASSPSGSTSVSPASQVPTPSPNRSTSVSVSPTTAPSPSRSDSASPISPNPAPSPSRSSSVAAASPATPPPSQSISVSATGASHVSAGSEASSERQNVVSLRPTQPAPLKTPVAKEVLAFEDAIRQVAAETTSKPGTQRATPPRPEAGGSRPPLPTRVDLPKPELPVSDLSFALLPARQRLLIGRTSRKQQQVASLPEVVDEENDLEAATAKGALPVKVKAPSARKGQEASELVDEAHDPATVSQPAEVNRRSSPRGREASNFVEEARDPRPATAKVPQSPRPSRDLLEPIAPDYPPTEVNARSSRKRQDTSFREAVDEAHDIGAATPKTPPRFSPSRDLFDPTAPVKEAAPTRFKRHIDPQVSGAFDYDTPREGDFEPADEPDEEQQEPDLEPVYEPEDAEPLPAPPPRRLPPRQRAPQRVALQQEQVQKQKQKHQKQKRQSISYGGLARLFVVLLILAGLVAAISWQWSTVSDMYQFLNHIGDKSPSRVTAGPEFAPRVTEELAKGQAPGAAMQSSQTALPAASLIEADSSDPQGKRYVGNVAWRTETISGGPGLAPELAVRADIEIPERRMTVTWSMRRNTDKTLPASHTIEIMFNLPADFSAGAIANVPAIVMKTSEEARGNKLIARVAKVTNGYFLMGLSETDTDVQRDKQLLKDRPWFDIGIVYTNGTQAILAFEKGDSGNRAFAQAFAAWDKK